MKGIPEDEPRRLLAPELIMLQEQSESLIMKAIIRVLDILILDSRQKNDEATHDEVLQHQGEIRAYKQLKQYLTAPIPYKEGK